MKEKKKRHPKKLHAFYILVPQTFAVGVLLFIFSLLFLIVPHASS